MKLTFPPTIVNMNVMAMELKNLLLNAFPDKIWSCFNLMLLNKGVLYQGNPPRTINIHLIKKKKMKGRREK
jgi:hypothetical protein